MDGLSAAASALAVAELALKVGAGVYRFAKAANHVDRTLEDIAAELDALGKICTDISSIDFIDPALVVGVTPQLLRCQEMLVKLDAALPTMPANTNFFTKPTIQAKLYLRQNEIDEYRRQVAHSTSNLQLSFHLLGLKAIYVAPQLANAAILDALQKMIRLLQSRDRNSFDPALVEYADEVISEGRSLYAQSEAPASVVGAPAVSKRMVMSDWIDTIVTLRRDAEAAASSQSAFGELGQEDHRHTTSTPIMSDDLLAQEEELHIDGDEDSDNRLAIDLARFACAEGDRFYKSGEYAQAEALLQEGLRNLQTLPQHLRRSYDLDKMHFQLAVCTYWVHDLVSAEAALLSITNQHSLSDTAAVQQLKASLLLAQVYVKQGRLDDAKASATRVYSSPRSVLSNDAVIRREAAALLYHIVSLSSTPSRAIAYLGLIPAERREEYCHRFDGLEISLENPFMERQLRVVWNADRVSDISTQDVKVSAANSGPNPTAAQNALPAMASVATTTLTLSPISSFARPLSTGLPPEENSAGWHGTVPSDLISCRYNSNGVVVATSDRGSSHSSTPYCIGVLSTRSTVWTWMQQFNIETLPISFDISRSGKSCVCAYSSRIVVVQSLETGEILLHLACRSQDIRYVSFTAADALVLTLQRRKLRAWSVETGKNLWTYTLGMRTRGDISSNFKLSGDNCLAIVVNSAGSNSEIHVVDCDTGLVRTTWCLKRGPVKDIVWNKDCTKIAVIFNERTQASIYSLDGEVLRTITVQEIEHKPRVKKAQRTNERSELTWVFLENDLLLPVIMLLRQQETTLLAAYDSSVRRWWYIPLGIEVFGGTYNADGTTTRPSLSPDDRILLHADNSRRILLDLGAAIRHCRLQQGQGEIAKYEQLCPVPLVDDSAMA